MLASLQQAAAHLLHAALSTSRPVVDLKGSGRLRQPIDYIDDADDDDSYYGPRAAAAEESVALLPIAPKSSRALRLAAAMATPRRDIDPHQVQATYQPSPGLTKVGHGLAKGLGIKLNYRDENAVKDHITRGESVFSVDTANSFVETEPSVIDYFRTLWPSRGDTIHYLRSLAPFTNWILRYNPQWLLGDMIAGITVGAVVVPQSMAYAKLALVPVEFGLYSAFMGVMIYWFFATSKDITIGPVAVMSTLTGDVITEVLKDHPEYTDAPWVIAQSLAIICGAIITFLGFIRFGFIVDFISAVSIASFVTGAAINILVGQIPNILGLKKTDGVDNRAATYLVIVNTLKHLGKTRLDAALGLTALVLLYAFREICNQAAKRWPSKAKTIFIISTTRTAFVVLLYTLISWAANNDASRKDATKSKWSILGKVPRGFQHAGAPPIDTTLIKAFVNKVPVSVIVLLIEHIAISRQFGRINNYTINPSQELLAIGITNLLGPFVGAYPATGSFSRTAIKAKAGVRTPFAGVITGIVVLLAIYALPAVFYWIPNAGLAAVIIHAVGDLILPPNQVYQFWRVSPIEVPIFFAGIIVTVFSSIENGIYVTLAVSGAVLLFRIAKARGRFLGKVKIHSVLGDHIVDPETHVNDKNDAAVTSRQLRRDSDDSNDSSDRTIYLPLNHLDGSNPDVPVEAPYPGVFIYRFSEGFTYPNAGHYTDDLTAQIFAHTRRTNPHSFARPGDRPWNDPGPRKGAKIEEIVDFSKPTLKAIILDCASVNHIDVTGVQYLIDVRNQLNRYAAPDTVEWHFVALNNRWAKRALAAGGFGYPTPKSLDGEYHRYKPVYSIAEIGGYEHSAAAAAERQFNREAKNNSIDIEGNFAPRDPRPAAVITGLNRPFFHIDIPGAVHAAITSAQRKEEFRPEGQQPIVPTEPAKKTEESE